ncbi:MAG: outer membrane lipoprotein-sorting protein, partial [Proteobacteria bacterium]|nr:outer membrane lipoprotein-sorting protein [Pseudomonadota bacterium]
RYAAARKPLAYQHSASTAVYRLNGSMFGTGFSYDDFAQLQHVISHRKVRILDEEQLEGRANYVLETLPNFAYSDYRRVVTFIDKQWCIPMRTKFYGAEDQLLKEMLVAIEDVRQVGDRFVPYRTVLNEHTGGHTEIRVNEIEIDANLRDRIFTGSELGRGK